MMRFALLMIALSLVIPAGLALRAQEAPGKTGESLDDLIRDLKAKLGAAEGVEKPREIRFQLRLYDIRDLTYRVPDYAGNSINVIPSGGFGFGFGEDEDMEPLAYFEGDAISDMIRETIAPESWDELSSVDVQYLENGNLLVRHTPGIHNRISVLLTELRAKAAAQITMRVRMVRMPDAVLRHALGDGSPSILGEGDEARVQRAIAEGKAVVMHQGSISCTNNQRIALTDFARVSYLQDYDVEIAEGAAIGDPILQLVNDGFMVDLHPTVAGGGDMVVMQVRTEVADLTRPVRTIQLPLGTVDLPSLEMLRMRTTVAVPLGRTVVVGGALSDGDKNALLVMITPTATRYGGR